MGTLIAQALSTSQFYKWSNSLAAKKFCVCVCVCHNKRSWLHHQQQQEHILFFRVGAGEWVQIAIYLLWRVKMMPERVKKKWATMTPIQQNANYVNWISISIHGRASFIMFRPMNNAQRWWHGWEGWGETDVTAEVKKRHKIYEDANKATTAQRRKKNYIIFGCNRVRSTATGPQGQIEWWWQRGKRRKNCA